MAGVGQCNEQRHSTKEEFLANWCPDDTVEHMFSASSPPSGIPPFVVFELCCGDGFWRWSRLRFDRTRWLVFEICCLTLFAVVRNLTTDSSENGIECQVYQDGDDPGSQNAWNVACADTREPGTENILDQIRALLVDASFLAGVLSGC
jgi:hypothetical protein